jgi:hypothetical protein
MIGRQISSRARWCVTAQLRAAPLGGGDRRLRARAATPCCQPSRYQLAVGWHRLPGISLASTRRTRWSQRQPRSARALRNAARRGAFSAEPSKPAINTPTFGMACCARAENGQETAAPPTTRINSRRLILGSPDSVAHCNRSTRGIGRPFICPGWVFPDFGTGSRNGPFAPMS